MVSITQHGNFTKSKKFFEKILGLVGKGDLNKYGQMGVDALRKATPIESGKTANSWYYEITNNSKETSITWKNSNVNDGVPIAIILQYGHGTGTGGYVQGVDYINPAIKDVFDYISDEIRREVSAL